EVEQMLDDNPFLELTLEEAPREEFGLAQADTPVSREEREGELADFIPGAADEVRVATTESEATPATDIEAPNWDGDGSTEVVPDDGEWGGDAAPRKNNLSGDED